MPNTAPTLGATSVEAFSAAGGDAAVDVDADVGAGAGAGAAGDADADADD